MVRHTKFAIAILVVGFVGIVAWKHFKPQLEYAAQAGVSDVGEKGTISIAVDGWVGYFPFCSQELRRRLNRVGYGLNCTDDLADYDDRFKKLKQNQYDFVVATVDSYVLNGKKYGYPGPIISVIDESKGGDAIVAKKSAGETINDLKAATDLKIAFTPNSPSHHLLKSAASHFDVPLFKNRKAFVEAQGSEDAYKKLKSGDVDIAVLWEPEVTKAIKNKDLVRILGTEVTQELIVDILIASQKAVKNEPEKISALLKAYFETQKHFRSNPDELVKQLTKHYKLKKETAETLLKGVAWASLDENAKRWYGVDPNQRSSEALITAISSAANILVENGDFSSSPLPEGEPYLLTNSSFIKSLHQSYGLSGGFTVDGGKAQTNGFNALSPAEWDRLNEIGSMKARKISFAPSTSNLTQEGREKIDEVVADLKHYPLFRIEIRGHTGTRGDSNANLELSRERANAVLKYVNDAHELDPNRMRAVGFGGSKPLPKKSGESSRAYNYRLPRVEIALVGEVL